MTSQLLADLEWRGLIAQTTDREALTKDLNSKPVKFYIGFDPGLVYYIPNTFTPDGDNFNQTFFPVFYSGFDPFNFEMLIFNRWGELIWENHDPNQGWDGTYNGTLMPSTDYWFTVDYTEAAAYKQFKAHFTLKR